MSGCRHIYAHFQFHTTEQLTNVHFTLWIYSFLYFSLLLQPAQHNKSGWMDVCARVCRKMCRWINVRFSSLLIYEVCKYLENDLSIYIVWKETNQCLLSSGFRINEKRTNKMTICKLFNEMTTKRNTFFTYATRRINVIYCMHTHEGEWREKEWTIRNIQCHFISSFTAYIIFVYWKWKDFQ